MTDNRKKENIPTSESSESWDDQQARLPEYEEDQFLLPVRPFSEDKRLPVRPPPQDKRHVFLCNKCPTCRQTWILASQDECAWCSIARRVKNGDIIDEEKKIIDIDDFTGMVCDEVISVSTNIAGMIDEMLESPESDSVEDGDYENIKDICYALARIVARKLGFTITSSDEKNDNHIVGMDDLYDEKPEINRKLDEFI